MDTHPDSESVHMCIEIPWTTFIDEMDKDFSLKKTRPPNGGLGILLLYSLSTSL